MNEERNAARWLRHNGFTTGEDGRITYQLETNQVVRIKPDNEERWRAHLNRRWALAFPGFRFTLPTAATMTARHTPEGRAAALTKQREDEARKQRELASVLAFDYGRYFR